MRRICKRSLKLYTVLAFHLILIITASGSIQAKTFNIGGIPDQDVAVLTRIFEGVAAYLSEETGLEVRYIPTVDYAALVEGFRRGNIHLAWFGGLTGVQALARTPGAEAIVQRPLDEEFRSVFIVGSQVQGLDIPGEEKADVAELAQLKGLTFTFGSESSTSGHLMPRYFLTQAGVDPDRDFYGLPNYSGSHDATIKLVESGAFQAGALNVAVWESRVEQGAVDLERVRVFLLTPTYYDYHWMIGPNVDREFGEGTKEAVTQALLDIGPEQQEILDLFHTDRFIPTQNSNYDAIREVAQELGILR